MDSARPPFVRTRLSAMMFLEFFVWGGWYFAIAGYANKTLQFTGPQIGWLIATTALGAIIAPLFVGYVADRLFSTERVLAAMHVVGGVCLILAAKQETFSGMLTLLMINGVFFMPTLALANSLAFRHIPDPAKFPRLAVLGTIGWIASNLIVAVALGGVEKPTFFYLSGGAGIVMALYCLTLPHTPPKGAAESGGDVLGLGALKLLAEPSFLVFTLAAFLIVIPACVFFVASVPLLQETGAPAPLALMTLNQISEIVFMFTMPLFIIWLGLKRVLVIGMLAWGIRFLLFSTLSFPLMILGLILHGFCYSFVFVGAYMYVDKRAPGDLKASAQSLIAFLMLGVGWMLGSKFGGLLMDRFPAEVPKMPAVKVATLVENGTTTILRTQVPDAPLPTWNDPGAAQSLWRYLDLSATINQMVTGKAPEPQPDLAEKLGAGTAGVITLAEVQAIPAEGITFGDFTYSRAEMVAVFEKIAGLKSGSTPVPAAGGPISLTREQWLAAQSHDWRQFWLWPAGAAFAVCAFFALAFHDKKEPEKQAA